MFFAYNIHFSEYFRFYYFLKTGKFQSQNFGYSFQSRQTKNPAIAFDLTSKIVGFMRDFTLVLLIGLVRSGATEQRLFGQILPAYFPIDKSPQSRHRYGVIRSVKKTSLTPVFFMVLLIGFVRSGATEQRFARQFLYIFGKTRHRYGCLTQRKNDGRFPSFLWCC